MPIEKHPRTKNLGTFALKVCTQSRPNFTLISQFLNVQRKAESDHEQPRKHVRSEPPSLPHAGCYSEDSDTEGSDTENSPEKIGPAADDLDSCNEDDADIEVYEEDDIPHPRDHADLLHWLQVSDTHLAAVHTSTAPVHRGTYGNRKVSQELSVRRLQELKKAERERVERERKEDAQRGMKTSHINDFFSCTAATVATWDPEPEYEVLSDTSAEEQPATSSAMEIDAELRASGEESDASVEEPTSIESHTSDIVVVRQGSSRASPSRVTIEDANEEEDGYLAVEPCQLSPEALAEEGLDALLWDPAEEIPPGSADSPTPTEQAPGYIESRESPYLLNTRGDRYPLDQLHIFHLNRGLPCLIVLASGRC